MTTSCTQKNLWPFHACVEKHGRSNNNLMDVMTCDRVQHQAQMNVMLELHGGRDNGTFTS
jgi:hypothetical protein